MEQHPPVAQVSPRPDDATIRDSLARGRAERTASEYWAQWRRFRAWIEGSEYSAGLPVPEEAVARYMVHRARDVGPASLALARAAIGAVHRDAGVADPTALPTLNRVVVHLRRAARRGRAPRQARALGVEELGAIVRSAEGRRRRGRGVESDPVASRRSAADLALVRVMRDALLRPSEAAALAWRDLVLPRDGSGRVTVRRSKTDQDAGGAVLYLGGDAVNALRKHRAFVRSSPEDPVFPGRSGFPSPRTITNRVKSMCAAAGLGRGFSGHSPRVGMARDLVRSGASLAAVQVAGRWKSPSMPAYYARSELAGKGAVARFYGEG